MCNCFNPELQGVPKESNGESAEDELVGLSSRTKVTFPTFSPRQSFNISGLWIQLGNLREGREREREKESEPAQKVERNAIGIVHFLQHSKAN